MTLPLNNSDAVSTTDTRLRLVDGRLKMMNNLFPGHHEIARLEMIREDLFNQMSDSEKTEYAKG